MDLRFGGKGVSNELEGTLLDPPPQGYMEFRPKAPSCQILKIYQTHRLSHKMYERI